MPRRKRLPRPTYRVTFSSTLICTGCHKTATVTGAGKVMASVPEDLPPGWVCDAGDKRAILSPATGKPIELFNSGLVLAMFAPFCSTRCARKAGGGPILEAGAFEARRKLVDWTNRYVNTFRPRLKKVARELT